MTSTPQITFEVEETVALRQGGKLRRQYCPRCRKTVDMVSPDVLSLISGESEREIFRLVETDRIYFEESDRLVVCPTCYKRSIADTETPGFSKNK